MNKIVELLTQQHYRSDFDCGQQALNHYLKQVARQHMLKGISKTHVLVDPSNRTQILAFMTLTLCEVKPDVDLPPALKKQFKLPNHAIGAIRLSRLAVAKAVQHQGLGKYLVMDALYKTLKVSQNFGSVGLFVDAKDRSAARFYLKFGFQVIIEGAAPKLFMPIQIIQSMFDQA